MAAPEVLLMHHHHRRRRFWLVWNIFCDLNHGLFPGELHIEIETSSNSSTKKTTNDNNTTKKHCAAVVHSINHFFSFFFENARLKNLVWLMVYICGVLTNH